MFVVLGHPPDRSGSLLAGWLGGLGLVVAGASVLALIRRETDGEPTDKLHWLAPMMLAGLTTWVGFGYVAKVTDRRRRRMVVGGPLPRRHPAALALGAEHTLGGGRSIGVRAVGAGLGRRPGPRARHPPRGLPREESGHGARSDLGGSSCHPACRLARTKERSSCRCTCRVTMSPSRRSASRRCTPWVRADRSAARRSSRCCPRAGHGRRSAGTRRIAAPTAW